MLYFWVLIEELSHTCFLHFSLLLTVDLIAHQNKWEFLRLFWGSLVEELRDPGLDVVERLNERLLTLLFVMS